jgi:cytochrome c-type biogenesis protein CcmH
MQGLNHSGNPTMKRLLPLTVLLATLVALPGAAPAAPESLREFDGPAQQERYRALLGKLRCLVCQNESLASSDADLAKDLRDEVYQQVRTGKPNEAIIDYLTERYGDFVLYQPPVKPTTYLLWFGPFVLLLVGAGVGVAVVRRRARAPSAEPSPADRARAAELLGTTPHEEDDR